VAERRGAGIELSAWFDAGEDKQRGTVCTLAKVDNGYISTLFTPEWPFG
jgi:hypothetical protein